MLTRLRLTNFKSFADEEIELAPLTLLVGANASGKSNLLDAIWFLHGLSFHLSANDVLNGEIRPVGNRWDGIRGGSVEAARYGENSFTLDSTWQLQGDAEPCRFRIECRTRPIPTFLGEKATSLSGQKTLNRLRQVRRFDLDPRQMRGYGIRGASLGEHGENFSGYLAEICEDPVQRASLVSWLATGHASKIAGLDFIEIPEVGDVLAVLVEKEGLRITARSFSDGTLRFLGTLIALRGAELGSLVLIEGLETGLHPSRINLLVHFLESAVRERGLQVIATTHSPVALDWLNEEALKKAIVCGRLPEHEGSVLRRLSDLPYFHEALAQSPIDELFSTGWMERAM